MKRQVLMGVWTVLGLFIVTALALSFVSLPASAQSSATANTLKVSPVRTDVEIKKGTSADVPITITNLSGSAVTVATIENDFVQGDENGTPSIILDVDEFAPTHSLKRFMTPLGNVKVPANGSITVKVKITVPADAQAGGYFGALRFAPAAPDDGGQVNLSASVASLILLTVPGPVSEQLNLTNFDIQQGQGSKAATDFRTPNDLKVVFRFENKGNIQLGPFGKVSVTQGNKVVYDYDFNQQNPRDVVLPDGARKWEVPLKDLGTFGYYTVHATFSYGSTNKTIEVEKSFWVIPTAFIIAAIAIVVVLIAGIVFLVIWLKGRRKRAIRRHAGRRR